MEPQRYGPFPYSPIHQRPKLTWPNGARLALWVAPNIEFFPLDEPVPFGMGHSPDILNWSIRDYGNRVGVFRLMDVLSNFKIRATAAVNAWICDIHPEIVDEAMKRGWEFMGHGETNSHYLDAEPDAERQVILATLDRIERFTGARPKGWVSPGVRLTWNTLNHLAEAGCQYVGDFTNDDQPYPMDLDGRRLVSIPYAYETNDFPHFMRLNQSAEEFENKVRREFDVLYRESADSGRVMGISLHPFIIGVAHRIGALEAALEYICGHDGVWLATGSEIIAHFLAATGES